MSQVLIATILTLCALGVIAAVILYFVAQKFKVYEDPRIDVTETMLPGANCGGCGYPGCRGFADALVKNDDISQLFCPVGGAPTMLSVAEYLGKAAPEKEPQVAEVRCNGTCAHRPRTNVYDGATSCAVACSLYGGDTGCTFGCLGMGDCVAVCNFDALHINTETMLPEVDVEKCTACGACVKACPKIIIELRKKGPKNRRVYVSCVNKDKGAVARKSCQVACIACGKCAKVCPFEAITIENNLAFIDSFKCRLCRKCVAECPTGAIIEVNFPPRVNKDAAAKSEPSKAAAGGAKDVSKGVVAPKAADMQGVTTKASSKETVVTAESAEPVSPNMENALRNKSTTEAGANSASSLIAHDAGEVAKKAGIAPPIINEEDKNARVKGSRVEDKEVKEK